MKLLITGASGFIGSALIDRLLANEHQVIGLSRKPERLQKKRGGSFRAIRALSEIASDESIEAVINLAGEPILDKRWSEARKQLLYDSRLDTTAAVIALIKRLEQRPQVLISGSAIGFYGSHQGDRMLDEQSEGRLGFTHKLCSDWENLALDAQAQGVRVCLLRTGVVLGNGGALKRMLPPFKFALGGPIASGKQWFSWVHLADMVAIIQFLLDHQVLSGAFNATAPEPVTNAVFSQSLARTLHRPAVLPMPGFVMRLLLGEGAELLCEGQRVVPARLQEAGFEFSYPQLDQALKSLL
ncbi:MAG: TIGR01777 family oxidoreductase [Halopseudomonas sp.]